MLTIISYFSGFGGNTTESLCARWAMLGAFGPFYRNHNGEGMISQEFYRWDTVAQAAKKAIDIRYRLLDYFYTALHQASLDGTPVLQPLWFHYPQDANTSPIDLQFFFGDSILVSPVTDENSTSVSLYLPDDIFYDFVSHEEINGSGATVQLTDVDFTTIPVYIKGGSVLPLRVESALTTTELRTKDFELVVAPNREGEAEGNFYYDDGVSIEQSATLDACFHFSRNQLKVETGGDFDVGDLKYTSVTILGLDRQPSTVILDGRRVDSSSVSYDATAKSVTVKVGKSLSSSFTVQLS
jgi:alpha-glucosidase